MDDDKWLCSVCGDEPFLLSRVEGTDAWICEKCWETIGEDWLDLVLLVKEATDD